MFREISDNEIYLLIKYIKSVLWRVAKRVSYIDDERCLKVNTICTSYSRCQVYCLTQMSAISFTESSTQLHHLHACSSATCPVRCFELLCVVQLGFELGTGMEQMYEPLQLSF